MSVFQGGWQAEGDAAHARLDDLEVQQDRLLDFSEGHPDVGQRDARDARSPRTKRDAARVRIALIFQCQSRQGPLCFVQPTRHALQQNGSTIGQPGGARIQRRVDLSNDHSLLLIHLMYHDARQGNGRVRGVVRQLASQRQGEAVDLAGGEKRGQRTLSFRRLNRPIAQARRRHLLQFQIGWNADADLEHRAILREYLDFAFQRRFRFTQAENRSYVGGHSRFRLGNHQANLKRCVRELVGLIVLNSQRTAKTHFTARELLADIHAVRTRHSLAHTRLQFDDRAAAQLQRASMQGRVGDRDIGHSHGSRLAGREHHAARQMNYQLFSLFDGLE